MTAAEKLKIQYWGTSVFSENTVTSYNYFSEKIKLEISCKSSDLYGISGLIFSERRKEKKKEHLQYQCIDKQRKPLSDSLYGLVGSCGA